MDNKIFIRERLNIVDYNNNNQGIIYTSSDIDIEGGAVNVQLESDVGGWHQLTFDMPAFIVEEGKHIKNPLLKHLFPLTKIQYTRVVKEGNEEKELILYFIVQPQDGTRDDSGIVLYNFTCIDYPRHYLSKAKNGITIGEDTIDEKRSMTPNNEIIDIDGETFYVKADVQMRTDFLNLEQLATWGDAKPGAFAYIPSTKKAYRLTGVNPAEVITDEKGKSKLRNWYELQPNQSYTMDGDTPVPEPVWSPDWGDYPLAPDPNKYDYGALGINDFDEQIVQFYWDMLWTNPDRKIGRYDGVLYTEGSRLLFEVSKTLDYKFPDDFLGTYFLQENLNTLVASYNQGATAYIIETQTVWRYNGEGWEDTHQNKREAFKSKPTLKGVWSKLDPMKAFLAPNYAEKYLDYILEGTGWKVGEVDKIMVDTSTVEFGEDGVVHPKQQELATFLYFENSNAYNAITELCNSFKCYPRFDHVNKTVSLKAVPGLDYGLTYQWRDNLANTRITQDGEKAVSKLWVYGGEDKFGQVYIQDCNRMNPDYYLADYISLQDLKDRAKNPNEGQYAKVSTSYTWKQLVSQTLNKGKRLPIVNTFKTGELRATNWGTGSIPEVKDLSDLPKTGSLGQTIFVENQNSYWSWFPEGEAWYDTYQENEPQTDTETIKFEQRYDYINNEWVDKGQFYHWYEVLSPFADNYIMDFSYFLDRKLMTKEQEKDIKYNYILPISRLNKKRWPLYTEYQNLSDELLTWNRTYDECKIARDAIDKSLRSSYSIYQKDSTGKWVIKELNISAYPPGANFDTGGWIKTEIPYSESDAPTFSDFNSLPTDAEIGDFAKVSNDLSVYLYSEVFNFDDTICSYLGYSSNQITNTEADFKRREGTGGLLFSENGELEARQRGMGLFEKFREEELVPDTDTDKTYASLAPWYNPPGDIQQLPNPGVSDPSVTSIKHSYYDSRSRYITEQLNMDDALERIGQIETELTLLLEKIELLENQINQLEWSLREKYGDFIVEGVFTDDTLVWKYNLWYGGLEALQLYHRPLVTYELGVVDISGLPEYRTVTTDIYHDIVYRMNQAELVLPEPGDYCYVTDNTLGLVAEKANITSIIRNLSNPSQHQITIATVDTNTEDLIGKVVTAANTIYSKEQIYNRSAIVKADGTIAQDSIVSSLDDNSGKLTFMSNNGTVILGDTGITTVDYDNAQLRMQYTGKGIFASTNGGVTWENIVSAGKISIKSLSAGTIDSNVISVTNIGHDSSIIIDGKGISAVKYDGQSSKSGTGTNKTTYFDPERTAFFLDAQTGNAYFRGTVQAAAGDIGGWNIQPGKLYSGSGNTFVGISTSTKEDGADSTYAFWAGNDNPANAPYSVTHDGKLSATGANISGVIRATAGSEVNDGTVGGWYTNENGLSKNDVYISSGGISGTVNGHSDSWTLYSRGNFGVTTGGYLYATNANIQGTITTGNLTATGGSISNLSASNITANNLKINSGTFTGSITSSSINGGTITGSSINIGNGRFKVNSSGTLSATGATINGSFNTSGWEITTDYIRSRQDGRTTINANGSVAFYTNGAGGDYIFNNGMTLHSTAAQKIYSGTGVCIAAGAENTPSTNQVYLYSYRKDGEGASKNDSAIYGYTRGSIRFNAGRNLWCYGGSIILESSSSGIYIGSGGNLGSVAKEINIGGTMTRLTLGGRPYSPTSSKNMKKNIREISAIEQKKLYNSIRDMKFYEYEYKDKYNPYSIGEKQRGFIIEDIENTLINEYLKTKQDETDPNIKSFDPIGLNKLTLNMVSMLAKKVDYLESQIKKS